LQKPPYASTDRPSGGKLTTVEPDRQPAERTARQLLQQVPAGLNVGRGGLRIRAEFVRGELSGPIEVTAIRVPPDSLRHLEITPADELLELLQQAARQLRLDGSHDELAVEYAPGRKDEGMHIRWVDLTRRHSSE
jgi:hypothetical protein